jgi:hypothetical protein
VQDLQQRELVGGDARIAREIQLAVPAHDQLLDPAVRPLDLEGGRLRRDATLQRPGAQQPAPRRESPDQLLELGVELSLSIVRTCQRPDLVSISATSAADSLTIGLRTSAG